MVILITEFSKYKNNKILNKITSIKKMQELTNIMKGQYKKLYLNCLKSGSIQFANCKGRKFINQDELENCQTLFKYLQTC